MLVMKLTDDPAFAPRKFDHIECDICGKHAPLPAEIMSSGNSLMDRGWYVLGGKHRCPKHFHDDAPKRELKEIE